MLEALHYYDKGNQTDCQSSEDIKKFYDVVSGKEEKLKEIIIKPNCNIKMWKLTDVFADVYSLKSATSKIAFRVASLTDKIVIEEEFQVYNIKQWIGDFGGYLGLLFGASIPSLFEWLQSLFDKIKRHSVTSNVD